MIILVAGPESSGTRVAARALSQHPDITGHPGGHEDFLDDFWGGTGQLPDVGGHILTRRSLPAASRPGRPAGFMEFPDLDRLVVVANEAAQGVGVVVTSRDPMATLESAASKRASTQGSRRNAYRQYCAAYVYLLQVIGDHGLPFVVTSLEGFARGADYAASVFQALGLTPYKPDLSWMRA